MKRFSSPETLGAMIYPPQEKKNQKQNFTYSAEFQAMLDGLDDDDFTEESSQSGEKKRRLSFDQVKALEKMFEVDNKVEPEQKVKIAEELGLQPRQVAIWFQNRRARWKTKQLERDFGVLKADYEALRINFDKLEKEKAGLVSKVKELRARLGEENTKSNHSVEEETLFLESENKNSGHSKYSLTSICSKPEQSNPDYEIPENASSLEIKDGLSERNCSGLFNGENDLNSQIPTPPPPPSSNCLRFECSSSVYSPWMNCFQLLDSRGKEYQQQFVKVEEQSTLFNTEDSSSNIFSVDQAPTFHWHHYN